MDPAQLYETVIVNRDAGESSDADAIRILTIPRRSLVFEDMPPVERLADELGLDAPLRLRPVEAWSLPFLIDASLGRYPDFPWVLEVWPGSKRRGEGPSRFAQHVVYEHVVPFESSPLRARSLAELLTAGGGATTGAVGVVEGHPLLILAIPAGIIIVGAARGIAEGLRIGLRAKVLTWMGVDNPAPDEGEPPDPGR